MTTAALSETDVVKRVPKGLLIGGQWVPAASGKTLVVEDPATGDALAEVADGDAIDALAALAAASEAQPGWAATPPRERGEILRGAFEAISADVENLALLMTLEMGKALPESQTEVAYSADFLRWFSEEAVPHRRWLPGGAARREPVGGDAPTGRARPSDHSLELSDGHGDTQDRTGHRGRLHHGPETVGADAAVVDGPGPDPHGRRTAARRAQCGDDLRRRRHHRTASGRQSAAQAVVHRFDGAWDRN